MPVVANLTTMQLANLFSPSQTNFFKILSCITAKQREYCQRVYVGLCLFLSTACCRTSSTSPLYPFRCVLWENTVRKTSIQIHHRQTSCSDIVCFPYTQFTSSLQVHVSLPADDKLRLSVVLEIISVLKWCLWLKRLFCCIDFFLSPFLLQSRKFLCSNLQFFTSIGFHVIINIQLG